MRVRYTLPRDKLLKKDFRDIKLRKLKDCKSEQNQKAADTLIRYIIELNRITPKSSNEM